MTSRSPSPRADDRMLRNILARIPDDSERLASVTRTIPDWSSLLALAAKHGVAGVLLRALRRADLSIPREAKEACERIVLLESVRQDVMCRTLRSVLDALAKHRITHAVLKGPTLAARLYSPDEARPSTDLDLLVDPSDVDAAAEALAPLGYVLEGGAMGRFFREHHHHVHVHHRSLPIVELHLEAYRGFGTSLSAAPLLARSIPCVASGFENARVLAPEDELIYLAVHAASHRFERLSWLFDLKLFCLAHPGLRWDVVASRAKERRLSSVVSLTMIVLEDWLGARVEGAAQLRPMGDVRARTAETLTRPRANHLANAAAAFAFSAVLCDDPSSALAFAARFVGVKVLHEAPLRAQAFFAS